MSNIRIVSKYALVAQGLASRVYAAGLLHLLLSIFFVQGMVYLVQFVIARLIDPVGFGIVRSVEAVIGIAVVLGSAGMPTLAVKAIAEISDPAVRKRLLGRLVRITAVVSVTVAVFMALIGSWFVVPGAYPYLKAMIWVIALTTASRTIMNYFQGISQFQKMSIMNACLAAISCAALAAMVVVSGLRGWLAGRYLGEVLFLAGGAALIWGKIQFSGEVPAAYSFRRLVPMGVTISLSLVVRVTIDNIGLFVLGYTRQSPEAAGLFGLSLLIITGAGILHGGIVSVTLPRMVEKMQVSRPDAWRFYVRVLKWMLALTLLIAVTVIVASPSISFIFGGNYAPAAPVLAILSLCIPLRAVTALTGALLLTSDGVNVTLWINLVCLVFSALILPLAVKSYGINGLAWGALVVEGLCASLYVLATRGFFAEDG